MADLTGESISSTYNTLLTTAGADISGSLQAIQDGRGNPSALQLSTTEVSVAGSLGVVGGNVTIDEGTYLKGDGYGSYANRIIGTGSNLTQIFGEEGIKLVPDAAASGSNVTIFDDEGNVGIGLTPSAKLDVTTSDSDVAFFRSSNATTTNFYINNTVATTDNTANLILSPANNVGGAQISAIAIEDFSIEANRTADLAFYTRLNGSALTERMRIDSNGAIKSVVAGNNEYGGNIQLGITTDDTAKYGAITTTQYDSGTETEGFYALTTYSASDENRVVIGGGLGEANAVNNIIFNTAVNQTTRNGTERMRIDSDGNVGINETSVSTTNSTKLEVKSSAASVTSAIRTANKDVTAGTAQGAAIDFGLVRDSGAYKPQAGRIIVGRDSDWDASDTNIDAYMSFSTYQNNGLVEHMRIDSSGNVGIGTTPTSSYKLLVSGDICASGGHLHVTGSSSTASGQSLYAPASNTMAFSTNSVEAMRIDSSQRVIITNMPTSDPAIAGALFSDGAAPAGGSATLKISGGPA